MTGQPNRCTDCGHKVSEQARFCEQCGAPLKPGAEPLRAPDALAEKIADHRGAIEGERKQVTVVFTDIVRSMELTRLLDTERWGVVLDRFLAIACDAIHGFEGTVNQFTGDGLMAVFGAPVAHEDHARRACLTVLELQRGIAAFAEELKCTDEIDFTIRCGLNSGEVIVGSIGDDLHMDFAPIGNTTAMGKRMESLAPEGSAAISASTAALIQGEFDLRELGEFEVKGAGEPQRVFELLGPSEARSPLEATAEARGLSRFVGRAAERASLERALEGALAGEGHAVAVCGEPGVGKSRLTRVFLGKCRERGLAINSASAVAHGRAVPLLPVLAMFRDYFGIGERAEPAEARERIETTLAELDPSFDGELPLLFDFLGVPDPERPVERIDPEARQRRLLALVTRMVEARSGHEPAVMLIEDLHWIDEASAEFLAQLVEAVEGTRTLLVTTFRPEYPANWVEDPAGQLIALAPLDPDEADELLRVLLGDDPSLDGLAEAIQERTGGNPFFIEEVVQALAETGRLAGERGGYRLVKPLEELVLPPTVQAVLGARIDCLEPREKALVQTMSVIGKEVPEPVLREVTDLGQEELTEATGLLSAGEFLLEAGGTGHRQLAFKHPLTQEVAYASQLSAARAAAHTRVAEAIERVYPESLDERAALLAHHCEEAGAKLRAAQWHARAAAWVSVSSPVEGMRRWRRVRELTDELEGSSEVQQLAVLARISILALAWRLGMSHEETAAIHAEGKARLSGDGGREEAKAERILEEILNPEPPGAKSSAESVLLDVAYGANLLLGGRERDALEFLRTASSQAAAIGDAGLLLTANSFAGTAAWAMGRFEEAAGFADRGISLAGEHFMAGAGIVLGTPYAFCLWVRAYSEGCMGSVDRARRDYERALELAARYDDPEAELYALVMRAQLRSDLLEAEPGLVDARRGLEVAERTANTHALVVAHSVLAQLLADCGDFPGACDAAEGARRIAREEHAGLAWEADDLARLAIARMGLGEGEAALTIAAEGVAVAERRWLKRSILLCRIALARVLIATDDLDKADETLRGALAIATEIGYRTSKPRIHLELARLSHLRGDHAEAEREETEVERILREIRQPAGAPLSSVQN